MKIRYAVTFEFDSRAPVTHRGVVEAGQPWTCAHKAVRQAKKILKPVNWTSFVFVALERVEHRAGENARGIVAPDSDALLAENDQ